jgi:ribokinase
MTQVATRICMVGSSNTDLVARIPRLPHLGECLTGDAFHIGFGGKGANQAVMAARLGADVAVVTRLGRDVFGDAYLRHYREEGIDTEHVVIDDRRSSGTTLILVDEPTGLNTMAFVPGANGGLDAADVRNAAKVITGCDALLCQLEVPAVATEEAFRMAGQGVDHRPLRVLNAAPVPRQGVSDALLEMVDLLIVNEEEAVFLGDQEVATPPQAGAVAARLADRWSCTTVVSLGGLGVVYCEPASSAVHVPAPKVRAVDTTGAGDAFVASLGVRLASGDPLPMAVERAVAVATLTVLSPGSQGSYPTRQEVRERLGWW